jgi:hypothetical protein
MKLKNTLLVNSLLFLNFTSQAIAIQDNNSSTRFTVISFEKQTILQDSYSKLEWVNGTKENNTSHNEENLTVDDGCTNFESNTQNSQLAIKEKAEKYCKMLTFASYTDWRVPSDIEYQALVTSAQDENLSIYHGSKACNYALGLNQDNINMIATKNSETLGKITLWKENNISSCLRCVRDAEAPLTP